ncbi:flavin reductase [Streptomyces pharetrae CZA14]|uniref:Flavin reductase n=1 Tax=Streptomyces pharetrae CZA14 TaxID=1144883 RepID=A0ABX3Y838_9ACTN|nr:flavin reductase [Streptomyces pharetrae CZA14]
MTTLIPASAPAITATAEDFKRAFRAHPAAVVIITTDGGSGPAGFTATSLTSLSLTPPLVSFALATNSSSWPHVRDATGAVVHFLADEHEGLATRFATSGIDRFAAPTRFTRLPGGEPVLDGVAGWLYLDIEARVPAGDHHLVIGRVRQVNTETAYQPLVYHAGAYRTLD